MKASNEQFGENYVRSVDFSKTDDDEEAMPMSMPADEDMANGMESDEAATTKLSKEDGAQNLVEDRQSEEDEKAAKPQIAANEQTDKGPVAKLVKSWPMFTARNSLNRDDAILRLGLLKHSVDCSLCFVFG